MTPLRRLLSGLALLTFLPGIVGCTSPRPTPPATSLERFEFTRPQMGVPFRVVLYALTETNAQTAAQAAFERVAALNQVLSDYDPDSELNQVCHNTPPGQPASVSPDLWLMLDRSQNLARHTDGAFDATIGPLVNLWRRSRRRLELPPADLLQEARARVGWQHLQLDPRRRTVTFLRPDMRLDFGGIAKGYAADEALSVLRNFGIPHALVAAAGDVTAGEGPPGQPGWRVEVGAADHPQAPPPRVVWLRNGSVSTSGDIFQRLEIGGRRYSHIVDPRTGIGLTDHSLVTILAKDGTTADSLATAVSVLGPEAGLGRVERTPGAAALILRAADDRIETHESRRLHQWIAD
jgi:thiamine biosynthesis lipoprotein